MPNFTEGEKEKKGKKKSTSGTAFLPQPDGWGCEVGCLGLEWVKCGLFHFINGIKCNNVFFNLFASETTWFKNTDCICLTHFKDRKFTDPAFQVFDLLISLGITCYFKANKVWSSGQYLHRAAVRKKKSSGKFCSLEKDVDSAKTFKGLWWRFCAWSTSCDYIFQPNVVLSPMTPLLWSGNVKNISFSKRWLRSLHLC